MSFRAVLFPWSRLRKKCVISVKEPSYTTDKIRENTLKFLKEGKKRELGGEKKRSKRNKRKKMWIKEREKRSVNMYTHKQYSVDLHIQNGFLNYDLGHK
jgi:hypothetical protein